jgi:hypothetical protein
MSIRCVCQNGHVLKVKDSCAGTSGLCPTCRVRVDVPKLRQQCVSEDAILSFLGRQSPSERAANENSGILLATSESGMHNLPNPKKSCSRCNQEVSAGAHICPHCHTYIANLDDF